jgi:hypothetical protein
MVHGCEVVHGHHGGGVGRRGDDEIGPVHHVDRPDEAFERRVVVPAPEGVERSGRHGSLAPAHPGGQQGVDQAAPAPADRVGLHLEPRPVGQRAQRALAERSDAGGLPEQRRRIERDAEPGGLDAPGRVEVAQVLIAPSMDRMAPEMYPASPDPR